MTTVAPALSLDEWERRRWNGVLSHETVWVSQRDDLPGRALVVAAHPHADGPKYNACVTVSQQLVATIALANATLPDDSPYKITREDADELMAAASMLEARADKWNLLERDQIVAVRGIAAKLSALLPPEDDD